jgi:hypothetical protein
MAGKKRVQKAISATLIPELVVNRDANSIKVSETGFQVETFLGAVDTAQPCGQEKPVLIANSDGLIHYVRFGDSAVAAPTGLSDGIMVPPNALIVLASGTNTHIRSDSNKVGGYVATEQVITDAPPQPAV